MDVYEEETQQGLRANAKNRGSTSTNAGSASVVSEPRAPAAKYLYRSVQIKLTQRPGHTPQAQQGGGGGGGDGGGGGRQRRRQRGGLQRSSAEGGTSGQAASVLWRLLCAVCGVII